MYHQGTTPIITAFVNLSNAILTSNNSNIIVSPNTTFPLTSIETKEVKEISWKLTNLKQFQLQLLASNQQYYGGRDLTKDLGKPLEEYSFNDIYSKVKVFYPDWKAIREIFGDYLIGGAIIPEVLSFYLQTCNVISDCDIIAKLWLFSQKNTILSDNYQKIISVVRDIQLQAIAIKRIISLNGSVQSGQKNAVIVYTEDSAFTEDQKLEIKFQMHNQTVNITKLLSTTLTAVGRDDGLNTIFGNSPSENNKNLLTLSHFRIQTLIGSLDGMSLYPWMLKFPEWPLCIESLTCPVFEGLNCEQEVIAAFEANTFPRTYDLYMQKLKTIFPCFFTYMETTGCNLAREDLREYDIDTFKKMTIPVMKDLYNFSGKNLTKPFVEDSQLLNFVNQMYDMVNSKNFTRNEDIENLMESNLLTVERQMEKLEATYKKMRPSQPRMMFTSPSVGSDSSSAEDVKKELNLTIGDAVIMWTHPCASFLWLMSRRCFSRNSLFSLTEGSHSSQS